MYIYKATCMYSVCMHNTSTQVHVHVLTCIDLCIHAYYKLLMRIIFMFNVQVHVYK